MACADAFPPQAGAPLDAWLADAERRENSVLERREPFDRNGEALHDAA
jgi:hypothetical protein